MPEKAHRAAKVLGYTAESWDADAHVPYDDKKFVDCTYAEKNAAMYLKLSPIHKKLDPLWWNDVDEETKKHAAVLGWDQHKWDDDWSIESLPCEHWWWRDMTPEQQAAGRHFGYGKGTWDYVEDAEEDFDPVRLLLFVFVILFSQCVCVCVFLYMNVFSCLILCLMKCSLE